MGTLPLTTSEMENVNWALHPPCLSMILGPDFMGSVAGPFFTVTKVEQGQKRPQQRKGKQGGAASGSEITVLRQFHSLRPSVAFL